MQYKIAQLMLTAGKRAHTVSDIYIAQPDAVKESLAGKLFILAEIESTKSDNLKIIHFLVNNLNAHYYQNEKISLRERIASLKTEHIFEAALAQTNKYFSAFIKNEKIKFDPRTINITAGVIHDGALHFANTGKNKLLLVYRDTARGERKTDTGAEAMADDYKIADIGAQAVAAGQEDEKTGPESGDKLFANVVSGRLPPSACFLAGNEALPEYISRGQLIKIVSALPPAAAAEQMKLTLSGINTYVSFLGIIIKAMAAAPAPEPAKPAVRVSTGDSIVSLNRTEESTGQLLSPSGIVNLKKWLRWPARKRAKNAGEITGQGQQVLIKNEIFARRDNSALFRNFGLALKNILSYVLYCVKYALIYFKGGEKPPVTGVARKHGGIAPFFRKFPRFSLRGLSGRNRILLVLSFVFFALFVANIFAASVRKEKIRIRKEYDEIVELIRQKQNQAEANLLYSNEESARRLFGEIGALLDELPRETDEQKSRLAEFRDKVEEQMEKIRRVEKIDEPALLSDFLNLNTRANPVNIALAPASDRIYAADSAQKSVYILDLGDNTVTTVTELGKPISGLEIPAVSRDGFVYYLSGGQIARFGTDREEIELLPIELPGDLSRYAASDIYNNRLYLLRAGDGQIYRYNIDARGFSSPYAWIQEKTDLEQAADISIDGHIYVLKKNGETVKFLQGREVDFALGAVDPPLEDAAGIFVSPQFDFIYVLEPAGRRVVLFDKSGRFVKQYRSDKFAGLKDFIVDENNKTIYCLAGASLYSFPATHLE